MPIDQNELKAKVEAILGQDVSNQTLFDTIELLVKKYDEDRVQHGLISALDRQKLDLVGGHEG